MSLGLKRVSGAGSIRIKEIEMTERQKTKEFDFNGFFNSSLDRLTEIMSDLKETAQSEDVESLKGKVKILKELSDAFGKIDQNKLSRDEQKACKHFVMALDRLSVCTIIYWILRKREKVHPRRVEDDVRADQRSFPYGPRFKSCEKACGYEDVADFER